MLFSLHLEENSNSSPWPEDLVRVAAYLAL